MRRYLILVILFATSFTFGQQNPIFERLTAIANGGTVYFNIDGYSITKETLNYPFTEKGLKKIYRKYKVKKDDPKTKDVAIANQNFYVTNNDVLTDGIVQKNSFYFLENEKKRVDIIRFSNINKRDKSFEGKMLDLIINNKIPKSNFSPTSTDSINFAGRQIKLGGVCRWMDVNSVQCPGHGQMNWSVYKDLESAKNAIQYQFEITKAKRGGKVISEEEVDIVFEGEEVKAKKVVYDFKGIKSLLASMSGGETLTIYYVAAPVRGNYVGCVLSHWNNDQIEENGLPLLLGEVMELK
ncbi:hypothetical protein [Spongiivirga citrea]|uniref:Uncharacterized protein n=1 Tax=Spongiivirga citrea TaxID=1481457 RepID=A0A6M0CJG8_9FLAO|nr:hypothetical protein [Spongiivirga citrea]NER16079.1 hypothetical protein [Spongiivirga citrea]